MGLILFLFSASLIIAQHQNEKNTYFQKLIKIL